jgi:serine phosphatase RsbU (regulator of sigma subunit)
MEATVLRPEPRDGPELWATPAGQRARITAGHLGLVAALLVPLVLTSALGLISFGGNDSQLGASAWLAAPLQIVFGIWFGGFGIAAGALGPMICHGLMGQALLTHLPANLLQAALAGCWFRWRRLDPRLRQRRDWWGLMLVGNVLGLGLGAAAGIAELWLHDRANGVAHAASSYFTPFFRWYLASLAPCLVLSPLLLKSVSPILVRGPLFCPRFFGWLRPAPRVPGRGLRLDDMAIFTKLMILVLLAGVVPLYAIGGSIVWETLRGARRMAVQTNQAAADALGTEVEHREQALRAAAQRLEHLPLRFERAAAMRRLLPPDAGIDNLTLLGLDPAPPGLPPSLLDPLRAGRVVFYLTPDPAGAREAEEVRAAILIHVAPGAGTEGHTELLTGTMRWKTDADPLRRPRGADGLVILGNGDAVVCRRTIAPLASWSPSPVGRPIADEVPVHGIEYFVAQAQPAGTNWRILCLLSVRRGQAAALARVPNPIAVPVALAFYGCLIAGGTFAHHIAGRVMEIAERVRGGGEAPGQLDLSVRGRDELSYLAQSLNRMDQDRARYIRRLRDTTAEKERLAGELELARKVQMGVLPEHPPTVAGYDLAAASTPAQEVGGDFFDCFRTPDGALALFIGDAAGKGLRAALSIAETRGIARAAAIDGSAPDRLLTAANRALLTDRRVTGSFVTLFAARLDPLSHRLVYSSAGHHPPILIRAGRATELELGGLPLAVEDQHLYPLHAVDLAPGDCVVMYTDGVIEAMGAGNRYYSMGRLKRELADMPIAPAADVVRAILDSVHRFTAAAPQSDDLTLLVIRRPAEPG